jgi:glycosyltransferase involved in cell wall biosynthesis
MMPGNFDMLGEVFCAADLYVHPARTGNACSSLVRAMGAALPTVATNTEFAHALLEKNVNGLLTPARNPPALAEAMIHALERPQLRRRIGLAAQQTIAEQHPLANELRQYLALFSPHVDLRCESVS